MEQKAEEYSKSVTNRLARTTGHISAIKRMVDEGKGYYEVLMQLSAVKAEVASISKLIIKEQLERNVEIATQTGDKRPLNELTTVMDRLL